MALVALSAPISVCALMTSTNYTIFADAVETGGGLSVGGAYSLEDTTGESPAAFSTSSAYEIRAGYQFMERGFLSLTLSDTALNLGTLSVPTVSSASTTATVSTDSTTGYNFSTTAVVGSMIASVGDGAVTAGAEEYGFSATGAQSQIAGDVAVAPSVLIAATGTPITGSQTVLTFKAAMTPSTVSGNYSQTITVTASANL
jgi:hypothetical protein